MRRGLAGPRIRAVALLGFSLATCSPDRFLVIGHESGASDWLRIDSPIVVVFSQPLEPASFDATTARLVRERDNGSVPGEWRIAGATATFLPQLPVAPDLSDASFMPGDVLRLELVGLPRLAAIRSVGGAALERGETIRLHARAFSGDWQALPAEVLFADPVPGPPELLTRPATFVAGRVLLRFSEPLDPRAFAHSHVWLAGPHSLAGHPIDSELMQATLRNFHDRAEVELVPRTGSPPAEPLRPGERYELLFDVPAFRDLGGNELAQNGLPFNPYVRLEVARD